MSEVDELEEQLALAKLSASLEEAREAMHADRSEDNIAVYKERSVLVANARQAYRTKYPPPVPEDGDGVASTDTIEAGTGVHKG